MENRTVHDRRGRPATFSQTIRNMLIQLGVLVMHPALKAREEYRDNMNERDRRNRRVRRTTVRDRERRINLRRTRPDNGFGGGEPAGT